MKRLFNRFEKGSKDEGEAWFTDISIYLEYLDWFIGGTVLHLIQSHIICYISNLSGFWEPDSQI